MVFPPATEPQRLILCQVVLYTFLLRTHVGQREGKRVEQRVELITNPFFSLEQLDDYDFMKLCPFISLWTLP